MKINPKQDNRTLHAHAQDDGSGYMLVERERYTAEGYSKWDEQRIFITHAEIAKLAQVASKAA